MKFHKQSFSRICGIERPDYILSHICPNQYFPVNVRPVHLCNEVLPLSVLDGLLLNVSMNEIDFYFKPQHKNIFDQLVREFKKNKRTYFQEREQSQKINLDRKLEIIEQLKELINIDENINVTYKKFKHLQESWHKTGHVPRAQSNNIWQTYKHHTEIFYDFLHLNRELRDLDFKHNYEEKIKIIEQAETLSEIPDVLKASRDLNTLHRLWKNDLGPVAKEHREKLWARFQAAS